MVMVQSYSLALAAEDGSIGSSILHITDASGLTTDVIDEDLETQEYISMGVASWNAVNDEPFDYNELDINLFSYQKNLFFVKYAQKCFISFS